MTPFIRKLKRIMRHKAEAMWGRLRGLGPTRQDLEVRPPMLFLELTNICNARCVFCGYQYQKRLHETMTDQVFTRTLGEYISIGGGDVGLTPIVGEALVDPKFLDRVNQLRAQPLIGAIELITNGILIDRFGAEQIVHSGLTSIVISTSGFDQQSYEKLYRSTQYAKMRDNVLGLLLARQKANRDLRIMIALRSNRPLKQVMADPDFQRIRELGPEVDFTWSYVDFGGRIRPQDLPSGMQLRRVSLKAKNEPCKGLFDGPIVLPDGKVLACSCASAMDAVPDLTIGDIMQDSLLDIWRGVKRQTLIAEYAKRQLNPTCADCTSYRNLDNYRTSAGRKTARDAAARLRNDN